MVSLFYYLHEKKIRKYALHNTTIENYSVLLLGLQRLAAPNLGQKIIELFGTKHALKVASVNFLYDTKNYVRLQEKANLTRRDKAKQAYKANLIINQFL